MSCCCCFFPFYPPSANLIVFIIGASHFSIGREYIVFIFSFYYCVFVHGFYIYIAICLAVCKKNCDNTYSREWRWTENNVRWMLWKIFAIACTDLMVLLWNSNEASEIITTGTTITKAKINIRNSMIKRKISLCLSICFSCRLFFFCFVLFSSLSILFCSQYKWARRYGNLIVCTYL